MTSLQVVLRTCTLSNVTTSGWRRWLDVSKPLLVQRCLRSLVTSINQIDPVVQTHVMVLDDDVTPHEFVQEELAQLRCDFTLQSLGGVGHNASALRQFDACRNSVADWVYCVEDDYLHEPVALNTMIQDLTRFQQRLNGPVAIHPFDDPEVIAGQGTIAMEILRQHDPAKLNAIFVPIGGGGLIAGIGAYIKCLYPQIRIIGVEIGRAHV